MAELHADRYARFLDDVLAAKTVIQLVSEALTMSGLQVVIRGVPLIANRSGEDFGDTSCTATVAIDTTEVFADVTKCEPLLPTVTGKK